ncbi:heavy-metal-associated domain-containing protein [Niabella sp. W65]|nr:heavy-metal-associated domain-containing protein [Niabella sp. W65]MCH7367453.1 heavy-metal-associated domain-containing protein [Niabella sp. W65]
MDCATCALTINKYLNKEGAKEVKVNFATGDVSFENNSGLSWIRSPKVWPTWVTQWRATRPLITMRMAIATKPARPAF